jgi:hypothetical protein
MSDREREGLFYLIYVFSQRVVLYREEAGAQRTGRDHSCPAVHHTDRKETKRALKNNEPKGIGSYQCCRSGDYDFYF